MRKVSVALVILTAVMIYKLTVLERNKAINSESSHRLRIYRDQENIARIYAYNPADATFGLGYALAQDRAWTLFFKRMHFRGRMAEMLGSVVLPLDLETRLFDITRIAQLNWEAADHRTRALITGYTDGINAYMRQLKVLPLEFYLLWVDWEDWTPVDCFASCLLLAWNLQFDWFYELGREKIKEVLGYELAQKILAFGSRHLFHNTSILNEEDIKIIGEYKPYNISLQDEIIKQHWGVKPSYGGGLLQNKPIGGSNSWGISRQHTLNNKSLLANDPHLANFMPSLFYAYEVTILNQNNTIKTQTFGCAPDGIPSISLGLNQQFAWGSTASYVDTKDVYAQTTRMNGDTFEYFYEGKWLPFNNRTQIIRVRGSQDINHTFYSNHHGVVIENIFPDLHVKYGFPYVRSNHTLTLSSMLLRTDNTTMSGLVALPFSQNLTERLAINSDIKGIAIDAVLLLKNGSLSFCQLMEVEEMIVPEMGGFVKDGTTNKYERKNVISKDFYANGLSKEYFALANNRFAPDSFSRRTSLHEVSTGRSLRIDSIIQQGIKNKKKFTLEDMMAMQQDQKDEYVARTLPQLLNWLKTYLDLWTTPYTLKYFEILAQWNHVMDKDSVAAGIYHVWEHEFHSRLFAETTFTPAEKVAISNHAYFEHYQFNLFKKIAANTLTLQDSPVCVSPATRELSTLHPCAAVVIQSFKHLRARLLQQFGSDSIAAYTWGRIHKQFYQSLPFSRIPLISRLWKREQDCGGNSRTINVAITTQESKSYNGIAGPSFRFVTDMNQTYFSLRISNTDNIFSPFYDSFYNTNRYAKYFRVNAISTPQNWTTVIDQL